MLKLAHRTALLLTGAVFALALLFGIRAAHVHAQELPPPTKMTRAQADAIYRIEHEAPELHKRLTALIAEEKAIFADLQITPGRDGWNYDSLEILRPTEKVAQAEPPKPTPPKK